MNSDSSKVRFSEGCDSGFQHRFVVEQFVVEYAHHTGAGAGRNHDVFVVLEQLDCAASERLGVAPEASVEGRLAATGLRGGKVEIDTQAFQDIDRALTYFGVYLVDDAGYEERCPDGW